MASDEESVIQEKYPQQIGPYQVHAYLRKGGQSILYLALDPETQQLVILKVLNPKFISKGHIVKRFLKESALLKKVDHPNVIKRYEQGRWEQGYYIALEYVEGLSLREYLLNSALSLEYGLEIIGKIAQAIDHLHSQGIVHRDIKPENILISHEGEVKVVDLGIAHQIEEKKEHEEVVGTPFYMSPEQKNDPANVSFASDIYSLGILAYEVATGRLCKGKVHLSLLPKGLQSILAKSLQPMPSQRQKSVNAFALEVAHYLQAPNLSRERAIENKLRSIPEQVNRAQYTQVAAVPADWDRLHISIARRTELNQPAPLYDFIELPAQVYGILFVEPSSSTISEVWESTYLRGMVQALGQLTSRLEHITAVLNELVYNDPLRHSYRVSLLILEPTANRLHYISCAQNPLWILRAVGEKPRVTPEPGPALGLEAEPEMLPLTTGWNVGDILYLWNQTLYTPYLKKEEPQLCPMSKDQIEKHLIDSRYWPESLRAQLLLNKMLPSAERIVGSSSSTLFAIERKK